MLTPVQTNELLSIIHTNQAIFTTKQLGLDFLSEYDKSLLEANGVDWENLYSPEFDSIYQSFHLGMLAQAFHDATAMKKMEFKDLKKYVKSGDYIPITKREQMVLNSVKNQTFSDIRSLNGRLFQDINGILNNQSLESQREFLKDEIEEGLRKKKTLREISNSIHKKTGDWNRDFDRIVEYQANTAYQQGRACFLEETEGEDCEVYKLVFQSACKHCLTLYTTEGYLSEPKIFKLSELKANGSNIGRKVADWKPTIDSTHPFCFSNPKTPIYTSKGYKKIKDIEVGDLVLTHKKRFRKVTDLVFTERKITETYNIVCRVKEKEGREVILRDITAEHPVLVNGNWTKVKNIRVGQKLHMLYDKCDNKECKNCYPIYYRDSVDKSRVDHCSTSCKSFDNSSKRTKEERRKLTENGRKKCLELYPDCERLHTTEIRTKLASKLGSNKYTTFIENKLRFFLDQLNIEYKTGFTIPRTIKDSKNRKRYFYPDIYIPSLNIVLEADGINWHDIEKDKLRDIEIKESIGADVFRFTEDDIRNNGEKVFNEIKRILKNHQGEYSFQHLEVIRIEKKEVKTQLTKLYNFSVEEDESYIANGFAVHNCRCLLKHKRKGFTWNKETQDFDIPIKREERTILKTPRKGIRIKVGGEEFVV